MTNKFEDIKNKPEFPPDLFDNHDVVALAENAHGEHDETILKFLDQFIDQINEIFIELPIDYQQSIDAYLKDGQIDQALEELFAGAEKEGKNIRGLLLIIDKIKQAKKSVICFDSAKNPQGAYKNPSSYGRYFLAGESRDEDMFGLIIDRIKIKPGKYLLIGGANHYQPGKHQRSGEDTLGQRLADKLGDKYRGIFMENKEPQFTAPEQETKIINGKLCRKVFSGYTVRQYFSHETPEAGPGPGWDTRWDILKEHGVDEPSELPDDPYYTWEPIE
ncbi:MAG: hypothetical protein WC465_00675 [Patescibacteria group bacterium]